MRKSASPKFICGEAFLFLFVIMDLNIELRSEDRLLWATQSGSFNLAEAQRCFLQIVEAFERSGSQFIMVDGRTVTGEPTLVERFYYGEFVADAVVLACAKAKRNVPRIAYVLTEPTLDPDRLGETVAVNRGLNLRAFNDLQVAQLWLEA